MCEVECFTTKYMVFYLQTTHTSLGTGTPLSRNPVKVLLACHTSLQGLQFIANTFFFFFVIRAHSWCHGCIAALRLIVLPYPPVLDVLTSASRCLHARNDARDPSSERWNSVGENIPVLLPKWRLPQNLGIFLHAANLRHETNRFTSPPKEGVLRIFSPLEIRWLRPGLNPRT